MIGKKVYVREPILASWTGDFINFTKKRYIGTIVGHDKNGFHLRNEKNAKTMQRFTISYDDWEEHIDKGYYTFK